jgi:aminomethyltransferase
MTHFGGWEMPVQFTGIVAEHRAVRSTAGMFDVSHMGKFALAGSHLLDALQTLVPSDLAALEPGQAKYTVLLNEQGGILDDLIVYYQGTTDGVQRAIAIVNAATTEADRTWIQAHLGDATLTDLSRDRLLIAIQGPAAVAQLQPYVTADLNPVGNYRFVETTILDAPAFVARTGYTGEDGFEVMIAPEAGMALWRSLRDAGVVPCGLGSRDTLRLEAAMALYGQDANPDTTPLEAGLGWLVQWDKGSDFLGRSALEQQRSAGVSRKLVGLELTGRNIARHNYAVFAADTVPPGTAIADQPPIGIVTSGTLSPTLGKPIALAYVPPDQARIGTVVTVAIRGKAYPATVVKKPFYRRPARST